MANRFTRAEFDAAPASSAHRSQRTTDSLLRRYVANGRLLRLRAGLYAVVPRGADAATAPVDPYLVATKLAPDATVAYHAALQFWGKAYSVWQRFHFVTETSTRALRFRGLEFVPVKLPLPLRQLPTSERYVTEQRHAGGVVRVTTLERTLVDVLDAPGNAGGWEEVWRSLEMFEFFDLDAVISYAVKLGSALTAARVGFFLGGHQGCDARLAARACRAAPFWQPSCDLRLLAPQEGVHDADQIVDPERFVLHLGPERLQSVERGSVERIVASHDHGRHVSQLADGPKLLQQGGAAHDRHPQVKDHRVRLLQQGLLQSLGPVASGNDVIPLQAQHSGELVDCERIVIHDQDSVWHAYI
jgi:predicted transcriptional regulator of viral defense system